MDYSEFVGKNILAVYKEAMEFHELYGVLVSINDWGIIVKTEKNYIILPVRAVEKIKIDLKEFV